MSDANVEMGMFDLEEGVPVQTHDSPLIQRAVLDLEKCRKELKNFHFKQTRCKEMVDLLAGAIQVAQRSGDKEGRLKKTYYNIRSMVNDWFFESTFQAIFRGTINELEAGIIANPVESLLEENQRLEASLTAAEEARRFLQQALEEKKVTLAESQAQNALLNGELKRVKDENVRLKRQLAEERRKHSQDSPPTRRAPMLAPNPYASPPRDRKQYQRRRDTASSQLWRH